MQHDDSRLKKSPVKVILSNPISKRDITRLSKLYWDNCGDEPGASELIYKEAEYGLIILARKLSLSVGLSETHLLAYVKFLLFDLKVKDLIPYYDLMSMEQKDLVKDFYEFHSCYVKGPGSKDPKFKEFLTYPLDNNIT